MEEIDILDPKTAHRIIKDIESAQIRDRRRYEYQQHLCYSGRLREFVEKKLRDALPEDSKWIEAIDINIVQKIIDKLSRAYLKSPVREVGDEETKNEEMDEIYSLGDFDDAFQIFDQRVNLHKYGALWVVKREGKPIRLESVPSYAFFPIFDQDSGEMIACVLNYPGTDITHFSDNDSASGTDKLERGKDKIRYVGGDGVDQIIAESSDDSNPTGNTYAMWTKEQHAVYEVEKVEGNEGVETVIKFVKLNDDEEMNGRNDLGVIPFVYYSQEDGVELPVRNPISNQAITYNYYMSGLLGAAIRNIGTAKYKYPEGQKISILTQGLTTAVALPQSRKEGDPETDFSYENPQSDLTGQLSVYLSVLQQIFGQYGIRSNESISGDSVMEFNSGLERMIANADIQDHVEMMQNKYLKVEKEVFNVVRAYLKKEEGMADVFNEDDDLSIIFPKPKITISDKEKLDNLKQRKEMRLMSRVGQIRELDPNLSEEKAKDFLSKVDDEIADDMKSDIRVLAERMGQDGNQDDSENLPDDDEDLREGGSESGDREDD